MWEQLIRIFILCITPIVSFIIVNTLIGYNKKLSLKKIIITTIILIVINCLCYNPNYNIISSIIIFLCSIIIFKFVYDIDIIQSTITVSIMMIILLMSEFIASLVLLSFDIQEIRNNNLIWFISNAVCSIIAISLVKIPILKVTLIEFLEKLDKTKKCKILIFLALGFMILCLLIYIIFCNYHLGIEYIVAIISSVIFLGLVLLFIKEQMEYGKLNREYQSFIDYVTTLEEWIEKEQLNRHEYKNDLAILRTKVNDSETIKLIDDRLSTKLDIGEEWLNNLANIPKGGLKGLIYYKYILGKNNKINIVIDVSKKSTSLLTKIKGENFKDLCHLLGIYLDNAIDAAKTSTKKSMSVEIYVLNGTLNFVISNSYKGNINIEEMNKKGYTTKGKSHGNGLYFAQKIVDQNKNFNYKINIMNHFLIQKLTYVIK